MLPIPSTEADFTIDWFNRALSPHLDGHEVTDAFTRMSNAPGQTAEIFHIDLSFDADDCPLPNRLIAKVTSHNPMIQDLVNIFGQYEREVKFYQQFPDVGIPVPHCYYCDHDPGRQEMVILMKDLAPAASPSWAISPDQVSLAVDYLAPFHAHWWNDESLLQAEWMVQRENRDFFVAAVESAAAAEGRIRELFGDSVDYTLETVKRARDKVDTLLAFMQRQPYTLVHGDYHGKQMFFPSVEGGEFAVIDWQFPFVAQGPWDLARIISLGLSTEDRRKLQSTLFDKYYDGLMANGVKDYTRESFEMDARLGTWISQNIMAIAAADTDPGILEAECSALGLDWRDILLTRGNAMLEELDVLDLIERL